MTKIELSVKVEKYFKLLNTREKCEFLAFFPSSGVTQKQLAEVGVFSTNRSVVHYNLEPYRKEFLEVSKKPDAEGYKPMFLTDKGYDLQNVAQYMFLVNGDLNESLKNQRDFLGLFLEKGSPRRMLEIFGEIYFNGFSTVVDFHRFLRDRDTDKTINRLKSFGLIETIKEETNRVRRYADKTEIGELFGQFFVLPIVDHINGGNSELTAYLTTRWNNYLIKKGCGWRDKIKEI